ncbi:unnamed protein product, partial [Tilletia controversa]
MPPKGSKPPPKAVASKTATAAATKKKTATASGSRGGALASRAKATGRASELENAGDAE